MRSFIPPRSATTDRKPAVRSRRAVAGPRTAQAPRRFSGGAARLRETEASASPRPSVAPRSADGLPGPLQTVIEAMSGFSLADVVVHRNSAEPARLGALAFTRGREIHLAPGQERHLPHEAWHVVQQAQGRVKPTMRLRNMAINTEAALEREADLVGASAAASAGTDRPAERASSCRAELAHRRGTAPVATGQAVVQRIIYPTIPALLAAIWPPAAGPVPAVGNFSPDLQALFADAGNQLPLTDVVHVPGLGRIAQAGLNAAAPPPYLCEYDPAMGTAEFLVASVLHEMLHVSTQENYRKNGVVYDFLNLNLPPGLALPGAVGAEIAAQIQILDTNLVDAVAVAGADATLPAAVRVHVLGRLNNYARPLPSVHYDTVLADILAYMELHGVNAGPTFDFITRLVRESTNRRLVDPWWGTKSARRVDRNAAWWHFWKW